MTIISMMTVLMIRVSIRQELHLRLMMARESIPDQLLDCLEQNNAHATFFMLGQNVEQLAESEVQRMADIGCEIGSHSWDHPNLYDLDMDAVAKEFSDTDAALEKACGQKASVARAPYGNWSDDIISTVT